MNRTRIPEFDVAKGIAILLVVFGHIVDIYTDKSSIYRSAFLVIYLVHMPVFIFLAGLFDGDDRQGVGRRSCSYIALYVLLKALSFLSDRLLYGRTDFSLLSEVAAPWFMLAMAVWGPLAHATKGADAITLTATCIVLACLVGYDKTIGDTFCLSRIIVFFPFYLVGFRLDPRSVATFYKRRAWLIWGGVVLFGIVTLSIVFLDELYPYRGMVTARNSYSAIAAEGCGATARIIWYLLSFLSAASILAVACNLGIKWLSWLGKRSLSIYAFHMVLFAMLCKIGVVSGLYAMSHGMALLAILSAGIATACATEPLYKLIVWFQRQFQQNKIDS